MSDEMALSDNVSGDDAKVNGDDAADASAAQADAGSAEAPAKPEEPPLEDVPDAESVKEEATSQDPEPESNPIIKEDEPVAVKSETELTPEPDSEVDPELDLQPAAVEMDAAGDGLDMELDGTDDKRGMKRRASEAFSDDGQEFVGFEDVKPSDLSGYNKIVERLEAEVTEAIKDFVPVRNVMGTPSAPVRASKRARQDTDGSRPSSALSSRSDGDGAISNDNASSPAARGSRRATTEMSSPLLRVPLERGWRRELVHRAALDAHSRRNADIYYYTPQGKKLRSTREVAEHLAGTGLTVENFSFFKEPLGVDDPEKEIIRDAKLLRRVESPVSAPAPEGKRTPKPKPPKGASPDPPAPAPKSPPAKIKVKSMGSRLSSSGSSPAPAASKPGKKAPADNNNTAAWKKPRPPPSPAAPAAPAPAVAAPAPAPVVMAPAPAVTATAPVVTTPAPVVTAPATVAVAAPPPAPAQPPPPPPLQSRPPQPAEPEQPRPAPPRQLLQPCSLTCGRGVPSLACAACLCLYHPACVSHYRDTPQPFYCKNCRKSTSPPSEPPPLTHKSGVTTSSMAASLPAPVPRRLPVPVPVPVSRPVRPERRVLLRMKAASGGPEGERVWAVSGPAPAQGGAPGPGGGALGPGGGGGGGRAPPRLTLAQTLPQSLARINGRRFIVVPRALLQGPNQSGPSDD